MLKMTHSYAYLRFKTNLFVTKIFQTTRLLLLPLAHIVPIKGLRPWYTCSNVYYIRLITCTVHRCRLQSRRVIDTEDGSCCRHPRTSDACPSALAGRTSFRQLQQPPVPAFHDLTKMHVTLASSDSAAAADSVVVVVAVVLLSGLYIDGNLMVHDLTGSQTDVRPD